MCEQKISLKTDAMFSPNIDAEELMFSPKTDAMCEQKISQKTDTKCEQKMLVKARYARP